MATDPIGQVLEAVRAATDALSTLDLATLADADVLRLMRELAVDQRRREAVDVRTVAHAGERGLQFGAGATSLADLVAGLTRVSRREARARVQRAIDLGPRRAVSGEPLEPIHPVTAAALAAGEISGAHCDVISDCLGPLPPGLPVQTVAIAEQFLVEAARHEDPRALRRSGQLLQARLDPDGRRPAEDQIQRRRAFGFRDNPDGTVSPYGTLTAECAATWRPVLDALATPAPAADGTRDERTAAQRRHDAFLEAGLRLLRSGTLPDCGGLPATILLITTPTDLQDEDGVMVTGHGELVSREAALRLAGEGEIVEVRTGQLGGVLDYGRTRRFATPGQRKALAARDRGCSFPACTRPPAWTEVHHVTEWDDGGDTNLDQMCLLCGHHHRSFAGAGWSVQMRDGIPEWIPPAWLDPERRPRRNRAHHLPDIDFTAGSA